MYFKLLVCFSQDPKDSQKKTTCVCAVYKYRQREVILQSILHYLSVLFTHKALFYKHTINWVRNVADGIKKTQAPVQVKYQFNQ